MNEDFNGYVSDAKHMHNVMDFAATLPAPLVAEAMDARGWRGFDPAYPVDTIRQAYDETTDLEQQRMIGVDLAHIIAAVLNQRNRT